MGGRLDMPALESAQYLWSHLLDAGLVSPGGMSAMALSWVDLQAWQAGSAIRLAPWELRALRSASRAYLAELRAAEQPECPAPWASGPFEFDRDLVSRKVSSAFGSFAKRG